MKNTLLALVALIGLCGGAHAQSVAPTVQLTNATAVKEVVPYYNFCSSTTVGTTVTELSGNVNISTATAGIYKLLIQNLSANTTEYFSSDFGVTSATATRTGFALYPLNSAFPALPNWMLFPISTMQPWYGVASSNGSPLQLCKIR